MPQEVVVTEIPGVLILEPKVFSDARGFFFESFNAREFRAAAGVAADFVQDNHSGSVRGTIRGLHYQIRHAQGKLVRVVHGEVYDVAVDIRRSSPTFGRWVGAYLSAQNRRQMWIPEGFAHGFLTVSETAEFLYKTTDYWFPEHERTIAWDDADIGIDWPGWIRELDGGPLLAPKDRSGRAFCQAEVYA